MQDSLHKPIVHIPDTDTLTPAQVRQAQQEMAALADQLEAAAQAKKTAARERWHKEAEELGCTVDDILNGNTKKKRGRKPKRRESDND